ncbi:MAG: hypothetical protein ACLFRG_12140 [Desulfococcaceae bacterium]
MRNFFNENENKPRRLGHGRVFRQIGQIEGSARGVQPHAFGPGLDRLNNDAYWFPAPGRESVAGFGKESIAVDPAMDSSPTMVSGLINGVHLQIFGLPIRAGGRETIHNGIYRSF